MLKIMHLEMWDFTHKTFSDRKMTVCYDSSEGKLGLAFVHPKDRFVKKIGRAIAEANMNVECPKNLTKKELFAYLNFLRTCRGYFPDCWRVS